MIIIKKSDFEVLRACAVFKGLSPDELSGLAEKLNARQIRFGRQEKIFTPETHKRQLGILIKGSAEVYKTEAGASLLMSILRPSDVFGMPSVFSENGDFPTEIRAREDCRVLFIEKEELETIFLAFPQTMRNYIGILSDRILYLNRKIDRLSTPSAAGKLKIFLENTAEKAGSDTFPMPLSWTETASSLGLGRTSLYRAVRELEESGYLQKDGKTITLSKGRNI